VLEGVELAVVLQAARFTPSAATSAMRRPVSNLSFDFMFMFQGLKK
jgi:hypothetical protein